MVNTHYPRALWCVSESAWFGSTRLGKWLPLPSSSSTYFSHGPEETCIQLSSLLLAPFFPGSETKTPALKPTFRSVLRVSALAESGVTWFQERRHGEGFSAGTQGKVKDIGRKYRQVRVSAYLLGCCWWLKSKSTGPKPYVLSSNEMYVLTMPLSRAAPGLVNSGAQWHH